MLPKKELFDRANQYDFDAIREYLESGGNIEVYDGGGKSLLTALPSTEYATMTSQVSVSFESIAS